jgi:hypothetical protein
VFFLVEGQWYGIYVEELILDTNPSRNVINISFGRISSNQFSGPDELDLTLSGAGKPRYVLSTVGAACIANALIKTADVICLAATDEHSLRRSPIYSIAASEIRQVVPGFGGTTMEMVKTQKGDLLTLLVKNTITRDMRDLICTKLELIKI